jgi:hypothetical protein
VERYGAEMPIARQPSEPMKPVQRAQGLDEFVGKWVAVRNGTVIAVSTTSRGLAFELKKLGSSAAGAVMRYVAEPSNSVMVGLG